jgi:hypothetical protein
METDDTLSVYQKNYIPQGLLLTLNPKDARAGCEYAGEKMVHSYQDRKNIRTKKNQCILI